MMHQLQTQLRLMQQHQQQQRAQQQAALQAQQQQLQQQQLQQQQQKSESDLLSKLQNSDLNSVSDNDLAALISTSDFAGLAESLLKEMQASDPGAGSSDSANSDDTDSKEGIKQELGADAAAESTPPPVRIRNLEIPTEVKSVKYCKQKSLRVNVDMRAKEVVTCCESVVQSNARSGH